MKEDVKKKKKKKTCPYGHNFSYLQKIYLYKNLHTITFKQYPAKIYKKKLLRGHNSANIWCTVTLK